MVQYKAVIHLLGRAESAFFAAKKRMDTVKDALTVTNVCGEIMEVFKLTGFAALLTVR